MLYAPCPCQCLGASAMKFSLLRSDRHAGGAARITLLPSLKRTKIRFVAGSNGTFPFPCTKIPKVGVAPD